MSSEAEFDILPIGTKGINTPGSIPLWCWPGVWKALEPASTWQSSISLRYWQGLLDGGSHTGRNLRFVLMFRSLGGLVQLQGLLQRYLPLRW